MHDDDDYTEGFIDGLLLFFNPTTPLGWLTYTVIAIGAIWYFW
jgi:hypothetical protein